MAASVDTQAAQAIWESVEVDVEGNRVFCRRYGQGPAVLLIHDSPRTSLIWRDLAPKLADACTVIGPDLRAYEAQWHPGLRR